MSSAPTQARCIHLCSFSIKHHSFSLKRLVLVGGTGTEVHWKSHTTPLSPGPHFSRYISFISQCWLPSSFFFGVENASAPPSSAFNKMPPAKWRGLLNWWRREQSASFPHSVSGWKHLWRDINLSVIHRGKQVCTLSSGKTSGITASISEKNE